MSRYPKSEINLIYIIVFYLLFIGTLLLINFINFNNIDKYLSIVATILGILSICLTIYFYKETNKLYINMKGITDEIRIYTKHIFAQESERVNKLIGMDTIPQEKFAEGDFNKNG